MPERDSSLPQNAHMPRDTFLLAIPDPPLTIHGPLNMQQLPGGRPRATHRRWRAGAGTPSSCGDRRRPAHPASARPALPMATAISAIAPCLLPWGTGRTLIRTKHVGDRQEHGLRHHIAGRTVRRKRDIRWRVATSRSWPSCRRPSRTPDGLSLSRPSRRLLSPTNSLLGARNVPVHGHKPGRRPQLPCLRARSHS